METRVAALPGVESVALSWDQPVNEIWLRDSFAPAGEAHALVSARDAPQAGVHLVSAECFRTLKIALLQGRAFATTDDENAAPVAIVNATLARHFFPAGDAIGRHIALREANTSAEIVGVVADVRHDGLETDAGFQIYRPYPQAPLPSFFVIVRTRLGLASAGAALKEILQTIDPALPVSYVAELSETARWPGIKRRFSLILVSTFAGLALVLAAVGIYAVMSYTVAQRTREIGIRMALGARGDEVVRLVLRQGLRVVGAGLVLGLVGGMTTALLLRHLLFETSALDPGTLVVMPLLLAAVSLVACWLPARRATRVDPTVALHAE